MTIFQIYGPRLPISPMQITWTLMVLVWVFYFILNIAGSSLSIWMFSIAPLYISVGAVMTIFIRTHRWSCCKALALDTCLINESATCIRKPISLRQEQVVHSRYQLRKISWRGGHPPVIRHRGWASSARRKNLARQPRRRPRRRCHRRFPRARGTGSGPRTRSGPSSPGVAGLGDNHKG